MRSLIILLSLTTPFILAKSKRKNDWDQHATDFPFDNTWFNKGIDEPECGIACPADGRWPTGEACDPRKIANGDTVSKFSLFENVTASEIPWQVSLREFDFSMVPFFYNSKDDVHGVHFCSGTILNKDFILTAAHCLIDAERRPIYPKETVGIITGINVRNHMTKLEVQKSDYYNYGQRIYFVRKIITHPRYFKFTAPIYTNFNDIALLHLETSIFFPQSAYSFPYTTVVRPICLPSPSYEKQQMNAGIKSPVERKNCLHTGFGKRKQATARALQKAKISIKFRPKQCENYITKYLNELRKYQKEFLVTPSSSYLFNKIKNFQKNYRITETEICALGEQKTINGITFRPDNCLVDTGGPLACHDFNYLETMQRKDLRRTQMGIVTWGLACGMDTPGVYQRITPHYTFIKDHTNSAQIYDGEGGTF